MTKRWKAQVLINYTRCTTQYYFAGEAEDDSLQGDSSLLEGRSYLNTTE